MTCLTIGIGNTSFLVALWEEAQCKYEWRLSTNVQRTPDEYKISFQQIFTEFKKPIDVAIISSVVPSITAKIIYTLRDNFNLDPLIVDSTLDHGLQKPISKELGADLLANAVAAHTCYTGPCIIFDCGTAFSITAVSGEGKILGVNIFPGITTSYNALLQNTALLQALTFDQCSTTTSKSLGTTTEESLKIGILNGYNGVITYNIEKIEKEFNEPFHRIGTGGDCHIIMKQPNVLHTYDTLHTLRGLRILAERNHKA